MDDQYVVERTISDLIAVLESWNKIGLNSELCLTSAIAFAVEGMKVSGMTKEEIVKLVERLIDE